MTNATRKWLRAGIETLIHGGAAAIVSTLTAWLIDSKDWAFLSPNFFKMLTGTFAINGGIRFFQWWSANPLPPSSDSSPPFYGTQEQISLNPISKVQPIPKTTGV
jgi:hypothetical protein